MRKFLFLILTAVLFSPACKSPPKFMESAVEVKNPEFEIISIAIIQADLVNTMFEAVVKIDNPNDFAVDLSSIEYKLYGNGKFWTNGKGSDILHIPAKSSCKTEFHFSMNFINMSRRLLDDVIAMRLVNYRFEGDVEVEPFVKNHSSFQMKFDRSGLSEVKEKIEKKQPSNNESSYTGLQRSYGFVDGW